MGAASLLLIISWSILFLVGLFFDWRWHECEADDRAYWASLACYATMVGSVFTAVALGGWS